MTLFELAQAQTAWNLAVLQSSVATHARCGGIFDIHIHIYQRMLSKKIINGLRINRNMVMSLWTRFLAHPVHA